MPRIKRVISTVVPRAVRLPRNIGFQTAADLGAGAFQELANFGGTLAQIAENLQSTKDDLDVTRMRGEFELKMAELAEAVRTESLDDPLKQSDIFRERGIEIGNTIKATSERFPVQSAFQQHVNLSFPRKIIAIKARSLAIKRDQNIANLNENAVQSAKAAALSFQEPEVRDIIISEHFELLARMRERGEISEEEEFLRRETFENQVLLDEMDLLIGTDRPLFRRRVAAGFYNKLPPLVVMNKMDDAEAQDAKDERVNTAAETKARFDREDQVYIRVVNKDITVGEIEADAILRASQKEGLKRILKQKLDPDTDIDVAVRIDDLLDLPVASRAEAISRANQAKNEALTASAQGLMANKDLISINSRANRILRGIPPTEDVWFKDGKDALKDSFRYDRIKRFFRKGTDANVYWEILTQVRAEMDLDPNFRGQPVFERMIELAKPHVVANFREGVTEAPPQIDAPPFQDPKLFKNRGMRNPQTGTAWKSDGKVWRRLITK